MSVVSRGARLAATLALGVLVAGCGGSLADTDRPPRTSAIPPPMSPFCAALKANSSTIQELNLLTKGVVPPGELAAAVEAIRRSSNDLTATAPPELRTDVQQAVATINMQLDVLVRAGGDKAALEADPQLTARLNSPEVNEASQRVSAYASRSCAPG